MRFTKEELKMIDVACYQLLEALDLSKGRWESNEILKQENATDITTLKSIKRKVREDKILLERCRNCESVLHEYGKGCAWRSLGNEYCFDGRDNPNAEITKNFDDFQTRIARGLVQKEK